MVTVRSDDRQLSVLEDLDAQAEAMIAASVATARRLQSLSPPDPPKERIMTMETVTEQRQVIAATLARMAERRRFHREGPRGD
jgi:hypothetical protein